MKTGKYYNMITEIPKYSKIKMEINSKERNNPIAQDVKNGLPREYHGPIYWNYGCFPQTWEDPDIRHPTLGAFGDNDPIDVVEIGTQALAMGSVTQVKVLGALALIDSGELDWKVIALSSTDEMASEIDDLEDLEAKRPEVVSGIREWFRWYKAPDGKLNVFGFEGKCVDSSAAREVVGETHAYWSALVAGKARQGKHWLK